MTGKTALSRLFRHLAGRDRIDDIRPIDLEAMDAAKREAGPAR